MMKSKYRHGTLEQIRAVYDHWNRGYCAPLIGASDAMREIGIILSDEAMRERRLKEIEAHTKR